MSISQLPILIPFAFLGAGLLIPLLTLWKRGLAQPVALLGAGVALTASAYAFWSRFGLDALHYRFGGWQPPIGIEFVYDGVSGFVVLVINAVAFLTLIYSRDLARAEFPERDVPYYALVMLMMLGLNGIVLTGDLFNLFVFLEISSLSAYSLLAVGGKAAPFAAFRYLILGTVGGSLYLLGLGFLYTVTGTLNMADMHAILSNLVAQPAVVTGLVLITVGIGIKAALFPMHGWLPDVYGYSNSVSCALIPPIGTKVAAYVLLRILLFVFGASAVNRVLPLTTILGVLASLGILYGSIQAIKQTDLKRMLAYSSVSQIGYILLGISLASPMGFVGALLHTLNHAVMKGCLFMVSGTIYHYEGHTDIRRFNKSYSERYPWTFVAFTLAALSMIGLPPLGGFFSKWYLAVGTYESGQYGFLVVILLSSLLNGVYFFRILERVYLKSPSEPAPQSHGPPTERATSSLLFPTLTLGVLLLVFGLANATIVAALLPLYD